MSSINDCTLAQNDSNSLYSFPNAIAFVTTSIMHLRRQIHNLELHLGQLTRENDYGLQNVFDRFLALEKRQDEMERLVKSDLVKEYLRLLPAPHTLRWAIDDIQESKLGQLKSYLLELLEEIDNVLKINYIKNREPFTRGSP
jgi:hypothetical protein